MSRVIKFRAWNGKSMIMSPGIEGSGSSQMIYSIDFEGRCSLFSPFGFAPEVRQNEDFILMQFTGLTDNNGKEIYEGDVLKINTTVIANGSLFEEGDEVEQEIICKVIWRDHIAFFDLETIVSDNHLSGWGFYGEGDEMEVIGNIYENPDLTNHPR